MLYRDNADPRRFVEIVGQKGSFHEKGNPKYKTVKVFFERHNSKSDVVELDKLVFHGYTDVAASSLADENSRKPFGYHPLTGS